MENKNQKILIYGEKPYYSLDYYLKTTFGEKVYKISLNGGMSCPNRDGTLGSGGCIFCSKGGSGEFAADAALSIKEQINTAASQMKLKKSIGNSYIAYFQAYTNTYAEVSYLRKIFSEALSHPNIVALSIATRPDCLPNEVLNLLSELGGILWQGKDGKMIKKPVWIELGLQTIHERTASFIRRAYSLPVFDRAVYDLSKRDIPVIVHVILGLPFEDRQDMLETINYLNQKNIAGIKLQLMHILSGTDLEKHMGEFKILSMEEYTDLVIDCLEHLSPRIVVHRLTGDGPKKLLIAPLWSTRKREVLNMIHFKMKERNSRQGLLYNQKGEQAEQ